MDRTDTATLLERIHAAYGRTPTPTAIDEWARQLETTDTAAANTALDRIIRQGGPGPNIAELIAHLPHPPAHTDPARRHQPDDQERLRVASIQDEIRATLASMSPQQSTGTGTHFQPLRRSWGHTEANQGNPEVTA